MGFFLVVCSIKEQISNWWLNPTNYSIYIAWWILGCWIQARKRCKVRKAGRKTHSLETGDLREKNWPFLFLLLSTKTRAAHGSLISSRPFLLFSHSSMHVYFSPSQISHNILYYKNIYLTASLVAFLFSAGWWGTILAQHSHSAIVQASKKKYLRKIIVASTIYTAIFIKASKTSSHNTKICCRLVVCWLVTVFCVIAVTVSDAVFAA